jgi:hypothetical protein
MRRYFCTRRGNRGIKRSEARFRRNEMPMGMMRGAEKKVTSGQM